MENENRKRVLVTGASGFIGRSLCPSLKAKGWIVRGAVRHSQRDVPGVDEYIEVGDINESTDWQQAFAGVSVVIHLAARVHVMRDPAADPLEAFRKVNVLGTGCLARRAAAAGVKRFVFLSSVKVNGEGSSVPYSEKDVPMPEDAYGISKREAEEVLKDIAVETGLEAVILRLPLVYGPGVKANFRNLIRIAGAGLPLPFKSVRNQRSLAYVGNVVDAITACAAHPLAAGETFLVSDGEDVSTPQLLEMLAFAMNKKARLFSCPVSFLKAVCQFAGKGEEIGKLSGDLRVDTAKIRNLLGWRPPFTMEQGLAATAKWFLNGKA